MLDLKNFAIVSGVGVVCAVAGIAWGRFGESRDDARTRAVGAQAASLLADVDQGEAEASGPMRPEEVVAVVGDFHGTGGSGVINTTVDLSTTTGTIEVTEYRFRRTFLAALVREAKVQFGTPTKCRANYNMVRKFVRDRMLERKMRDSHICEMLDKVVALVFIPTQHEVEAIQMQYSRSFTEREQSMVKDWTPKQTWSEWWWGGSAARPLDGVVGRPGDH
jgi:hypothetical protein